MTKRRTCLTPARPSGVSTGNAGCRAWGSPTASAAADTPGTAVTEVSQPAGHLRVLEKQEGLVFEKREKGRQWE